MCAELGIDYQNLEAYHKNHINKCMAVAFVGYAFEDNMENGGEAFKLEFLRAQSHKVVEKEIREGIRKEDGRMGFKGNKVLFSRDDTRMVDCAVTGSTMGTADDPKFPLKAVFEKCIFPEIAKLVTPGGRHEGHRVVIQGDNAGPHQDATFLNFVTNHCRLKGWEWCPQAPQMPHMNVLDLAVFPAMSKRHTTMCRSQHGLRVLKPDEIWDAAVEVWKNLPCHKIAQSFVQANRIAKTVIKNGGDNKFMGNGGSISGGVREDFKRTEFGVARKDGKLLNAPN